MTSKRNQPYTAIKKPVELLFGSSPTEPETETKTTNTIPISQIKLPASQPRRYFDEHKLIELSNSIKELGVLEPLLVRPLSDGEYELVAGERRFKAAQLAGLTEVPVVIRVMDDITTTKVQLVENLQRQDLNPIEETEGILELLSISLGISRNEVISYLNSAANAKKRNLELTENVFRQVEAIESVISSIGKFNAESFRISRLPLLNLPDDILSALRSGQIEYTKARAIARIKDEDTRKQVLERTKALNLSLSQIKCQIQEIQQQLSPATPSLKDIADDTFRRLKKSKVWHNPKKQAKVEKLLSQLNALIKDDN